MSLTQDQLRLLGRFCLWLADGATAPAGLPVPAVCTPCGQPPVDESAQRGADLVHHYVQEPPAHPSLVDESAPESAMADPKAFRRHPIFFKGEPEPPISEFASPLGDLPKDEPQAPTGKRRVLEAALLALPEGGRVTLAELATTCGLSLKKCRAFLQGLAVVPVTGCVPLADTAYKSDDLRAAAMKINQAPF